MCFQWASLEFPVDSQNCTCICCGVRSPFTEIEGGTRLVKTNQNLIIVLERDKSSAAKVIR